jgi:tripartite-type tricarboxylate transporter receptor subunit TctC
MPFRLRSWAGAAIALALSGTALDAAAQTYPSKPVRFIVGFSAGGSTDVIARIVADRLRQLLGQPVTIDNRPGADGVIAAEAAARAAPDGYTFLVTPTGHVINNSLYKDVKYDPINDFVPVIEIGEAPNMVAVHPSVGIRTLKELADLARAKPDQLNYGSTSSVTFLATELLNQRLGIKTVRVPYKGSGPGVNAIIAGEVQYIVSHAAGMVPYAHAGNVIGLALTSANRSPIAPDLPTVAESGYPDFVATTWYGVLAPRGTPAEIVTRLNADMRTLLGEDEIKKRLFQQGVEPKPSTPEEFGDFIKAELPKWAKVVAVSGAKIE